MLHSTNTQQQKKSKANAFAVDHNAWILQKRKGLQRQSMTGACDCSAQAVMYADISQETGMDTHLICTADPELEEALSL